MKVHLYCYLWISLTISLALSIITSPAVKSQDKSRHTVFQKTINVLNGKLRVGDDTSSQAAEVRDPTLDGGSTVQQEPKWSIPKLVGQEANQRVTKQNIANPGGPTSQGKMATGAVANSTYPLRSWLSLPNLSPYQPSGWSDKITISDVTGTTTDAPTIYSDENVYVDWAVINNGTAATASTFYTYLYLDGVQRVSWYTNPPLNPNYYTFVTDANMGTLSAGVHTISIMTDATNAISESNESDNSYSISRTIGGNVPKLVEIPV